MISKLKYKMSVTWGSVGLLIETRGRQFKFSVFLLLSYIITKDFVTSSYYQDKLWLRSLVDTTYMIYPVVHYCDYHFAREQIKWCVV